MFVKVTVFAALVVPSAWLANVKEDGVAVAASTAVPFNATVGLLLALSLTVSVPLRDPTAVGVKKTEIVQVAPAANVLGLAGQVDVVE